MIIFGARAVTAKQATHKGFRYLENIHTFFGSLFFQLVKKRLQNAPIAKEQLSKRSFRLD